MVAAQRRRDDGAVFAQEMAGSLRDSYRLGGWGSIASAFSLPPVGGILGRAAGAPLILVLAWVGVVFVVSLAIGTVLLRSVPSVPGTDFVRRKRVLMVALGVVGGTNSLCLLLPPPPSGGELNTMMFALLVLFSGMIAANALMGFGIPHLFAAFAIPIAASAIAACLRSGGIVGLVLAFGCVIFAGVAFGINALTGAAFRTAARLRVANERLVGDLETVNRELRDRALIDELTGIANRAGLWAALDGLDADPERTVLFLDLDGFKPVNDAYGHEVGDDVLRVVARRLLGHVRDGDVVARVGGDEFVIVADLHGGQHTADFVRRLADSVAQPIESLGRFVQVSASIGAAPFTADSAEDAINQADRLMYEAKRRVSVRAQ